jgi:hypothetical protein
MTKQLITKLFLQFVENVADMQEEFNAENHLSFNRVNPSLMGVQYTITRADKANIKGKFVIDDKNYHTITFEHKTRIYQFLNHEIHE